MWLHNPQKASPPPLFARNCPPSLLLANSSGRGAEIDQATHPPTLNSGATEQKSATDPATRPTRSHRVHGDTKGLGLCESRASGAVPGIRTKRGICFFIFYFFLQTVRRPETGKQSLFSAEEGHSAGLCNLVSSLTTTGPISCHVCSPRPQQR